MEDSKLAGSPKNFQPSEGLKPLCNSDFVFRSRHHMGTVISAIPEGGVNGADGTTRIQRLSARSSAAMLAEAER